MRVERTWIPSQGKNGTWPVFCGTIATQFCYNCTSQHLQSSYLTTFECCARKDLAHLPLAASMLHHGKSIQKQAQARGAPKHRSTQHASRAGHRLALQDSSVLRSPRQGTGEVRDASPPRSRGRTASRDVRALRLYAGELSANLGALPFGRCPGSFRSQAWTKGAGQSDRESAQLPAARARATPGTRYGRLASSLRRRSRRLDQSALGLSSTLRAGPWRAEKKTPAQDLAQGLDRHVFLNVGGRAQDRYERLRGDAMSGGDVSIFVHRGMTLFASGECNPTRGVWEIRRRRASVRSGEFSLIEFLIEMGIEPAPSRHSSSRAYVEVMS